MHGPTFASRRKWGKGRGETQVGSSNTAGGDHRTKTVTLEHEASFGLRANCEESTTRIFAAHKTETHAESDAVLGRLTRLPSPRRHFVCSGHPLLARARTRKHPLLC
jgi:hypothetical protein